MKKRGKRQKGKKCIKKGSEKSHMRRYMLCKNKTKKLKCNGRRMTDQRMGTKAADHQG